MGDAVANGTFSEDLFDLCVIDTTDNPLRSPWTNAFFGDLKKLMAPHGVVTQNIGSMGDWLEGHYKRHVGYGFNKYHIMNVNTPEYPSPYFLALMTDTLDMSSVDWNWWSGLEIPTIYYHPSMHAPLFELPLETQNYYNLEGMPWDPYDSRRLKKIWKNAKMEAGTRRLKAEL